MVSYDAYEHLAVDITDGVATVTFRRPAVYNAINTETMLDLSRAFREIRLDDDVTVVVLTGEGDDAFSAGADIEQYAGPPEENEREQDRQELFYEDAYTAPMTCPVPTIAKINGYCVGGGLIIAMYCDLRVAVEDAEFGLPVTDIGQIPTGGSTYRAIQLVGEAKAKELVYTAGMIDAAEAHRIGLVNDVVPDDALDETVNGLVAAIQDTGRKAVENSKRVFNFAADAPDRETARAFEADVWWEQFETDERERLVDEFLED